MFNITYNDVKLNAVELITTASLAIVTTEDPEKVKTYAQMIQDATKMLVELCDIETARNKGDVKGMIDMIEAALKNF